MPMCQKRREIFSSVLIYRNVSSFIFLSDLIEEWTIHESWLAAVYISLKKTRRSAKKYLL